MEQAAARMKDALKGTEQKLWGLGSSELSLKSSDILSTCRLDLRMLLRTSAPYPPLYPLAVLSSRLVSTSLPLFSLPCDSEQGLCACSGGHGLYAAEGRRAGGVEYLPGARRKRPETARQISKHGREE
eukprot:768417-Hanusia_phi.AAC.1